MSIASRHRSAARLRFGMKPKGHSGAARGALQAMRAAAAKQLTKSNHATLAHYLPKPLMLRIARKAQNEREGVPLWMRECTNLLWFDLVA
jgi:hypothetical protein